MKQLYTRWGKNLDPKNILPEHPNPLPSGALYDPQRHLALCHHRQRLPTRPLGWGNPCTLLPGKPPFRRQPTASAGAVSLVREISSEDRHP